MVSYSDLTQASGGEAATRHMVTTPPGKILNCVGVFDLRRVIFPTCDATSAAVARGRLVDYPYTTKVKDADPRKSESDCKQTGCSQPIKF